MNLLKHLMAVIVVTLSLNIYMPTVNAGITDVVDIVTTAVTAALSSENQELQGQLPIP